jgi:hypothetical protein
MVVLAIFAELMTEVEGSSIKQLNRIARPVALPELALTVALRFGTVHQPSSWPRFPVPATGRVNIRARFVPKKHASPAVARRFVIGFEHFGNRSIQFLHLCGITLRF